MRQERVKAMERNKEISRPVVVVLPAEIDMTNAEQVAAQLRGAFVSGVHLVVADLTKTTFCDSAGIRGLTLVHQRATESGTKLNLAIVDGAVRRVLELMDLTGVLNVYPSVEAAATSDGW